MSVLDPSSIRNGILEGCYDTMANLKQEQPKRTF